MGVTIQGLRAWEMTNRRRMRRQRTWKIIWSLDCKGVCTDNAGDCIRVRIEGRDSLFNSKQFGSGIGMVESKRRGMDFWVSDYVFPTVM